MTSWFNTIADAIENVVETGTAAVTEDSASPHGPSSATSPTIASESGIKRATVTAETKNGITQPRVFRLVFRTSLAL